MTKILIIDDVQKTAECVSEIVESLGYSALYSVYPKQLFKILDDDDIDLIVLDIHMPDMDGFSLLKKLRKHPTHQHIPVIMLTSDDSPDLLAKSLEAGANDFVNKPLNKVVFGARVRSALSAQNYIQQLKQTSSELDELNKKKDKFFSILAHDLKAPFNGLLGFSDLLADEAGEMEKEDVIDMAQRINKSSNRLFKLLENLLEWARLQMGGIPSQFEKLLVSDFIHHSIDLYKESAKQKDITLEVQVDEKLYLYADARKLETTLRNLLSNAIKFTKEGGKIWIEGRRKNGGVQISIEDTGIGIPEDCLDKLFDVEFYRSRDGTFGEKGSGLGLLICKELVSNNNGTINVTSQENEGTCFTMTFSEQPTT